MRLVPTYAGRFYPDGAEELGSLLAEWFAGQPPLDPAPEALLVPHAGYVYSGATAARAFAAASTARPETVVVAGPSHRIPIDGAAVLEVEGFETPIGAVECDGELADMLVETVDGLEWSQPFPEHSLEVQLPMVRRTWPAARVVAVAYGEGDLNLAAALAAALEPDLGRGRCVYVASSDLSHYHARDEARILDARFRQLLVDGDPDRMFDGLRRGDAEACGAGPVFTFLELARRRMAQVAVVHQCDSGDVSGDTDHVVGYLSAVLRPPAGTS